MKFFACHLIVLLLTLLLCLPNILAEINTKALKNLDTGSSENKLFDEENKVIELTDEGRIVGGQTAVLGQFPYMVLLEWEVPYEFGVFLSHCGGSLISPEWVLTAAHCIRKSSNYTLYMGLLTFSCDGPCQQTVPIKVIVHEQYYITGKMDNDIALFQLSPGAVTLNANVALIQLPSISESCLTYYDYNSIVSGWGAVSANESVNAEAPSLLRYVDLRILHNDVCLDFWTGTQFNEKHVCASTDRNKDSCQGDSGGPLVIENNGTYTQIGIVSFGGKCADGNPGVYTRVASFLDWIHQNTGLVMRP